MPGRSVDKHVVVDVVEIIVDVIDVDVVQVVIDTVADVDIPRAIRSRAAYGWSVDGPINRPIQAWTRDVLG